MTVDQLPERIKSKICVSDTGCWLWTAYISGRGYAQVGVSRSHPVPAHRYVYELLVGQIPKGLQVDHLCRVRHCVNPAHLEPVTPQVNCLRAVPYRKPTTHCPNGHEMDPSNTYTYRNSKRSYRQCRQCMRARSNAWKAANPPREQG